MSAFAAWIAAQENDPDIDQCHHVELWRQHLVCLRTCAHVAEDLCQSICTTTVVAEHKRSGLTWPVLELTVKAHAKDQGTTQLRIYFDMSGWQLGCKLQRTVDYRQLAELLEAMLCKPWAGIDPLVYPELGQEWLLPASFAENQRDFACRLPTDYRKFITFFNLLIVELRTSRLSILE